MADIACDTNKLGFTTGEELCAMSLSKDELFRPTLKDNQPARPPYSVQVALLSSFLGGPFAAIAITAINSVRLRRWLRDLVPLLLALAAYVCFAVALAWTDWGATFRSGLGDFGGERAIIYLHRFIGLGLFGFGYLLHREEQRSTDFMALERPNGWIGGIACIVLGIALSTNLMMFVPEAYRP